ncbi:hypothetical protein Ana3638_07850 [Anaerocolumna sedimenticola]|uniref:Glycosyl transferase n=1 Tax=Anaerocolumna sedimenticola TaxID=2696063 RepID=A0A6P1TLB0_9FIRM|nr:hypothetical protein [Anaerocolumna sedimenticola]QHQ60696.1 hypothetical protein Ana3638_07850 [Anaerocolumna sedimenticola]
MDKNFCGLSNTSINLKSICLNILKIPPKLIAVDWWIFSILVIKGYRGYFIHDAYTFYRQHMSNTVGGLNSISEKQLIMGIQLKKEHYKLLLEYYPSKYNDIIKMEYRNMIKLDEMILNKKILVNYLSNVNDGNKEFLWWENIKLNERWMQK